MGKFDEAIAQYNLAIEVCPKDKIDELATFYQNRAAAYEKLVTTHKYLSTHTHIQFSFRNSHDTIISVQKKFSAVRADCSKALELKPRYVKALIRRARAMESCNELETALEDITAACILEQFGNQTTLYTADRVLKQLGKLISAEILSFLKHFAWR